MPDINKFDKLRSIGYKILPTCGNCVSAHIKPGTVWGTCALHGYEHGKHTGPARGVSIVTSGTCPDHERSPMVSYGAHEEFTCPS